MCARDSRRWCVSACVRKILCVGLVEGSDGTLCTKALKTRASQSLSAFDSSQSPFVFITLQVLCVFPLCFTSTEFRWSPKQIYRAFLPSFRDSLDTSWPLQYRSRGARWPAWNRHIRRLRFTSFFPVFFSLPLRMSVASCRYVEFFMNTLQTIHSQRENGRIRAFEDSVLSSSILDART